MFKPMNKILWPKYMLIAKRIKTIPIDKIENIYGTHNDFYQSIKKDIEKKGMLNPPIVEKMENGNWVCRNGNHRIKYARKNGYDGVICYEANNDDEVKFLSRLNVLVWEIIKRGDEVRSFEFIFQDSKLNTLIEKCKTLLEP